MFDYYNVLTARKPLLSLQGGDEFMKGTELKSRLDNKLRTKKAVRLPEIAIDLDGTLIEDRFPFFGKPIEANVDLVRNLYEAGYYITIFSARITANPTEKIKIENFLKKHNIPFHRVTNKKPYTASVFIDDRNISVEYNKEWPKNIKDKIEEIIQYHKKEKNKRKKANLEHPNTVIFEPNEYYPHGLTEQQIYDYYNKRANYMINNLKGKPLMIIIRTLAGDVIRKHDLAGRPLTILNIKDFSNKINTGRVIEIHRILQEKEKFGLVDVDPRPDVPFEKTKKVTSELVNFLRKSLSNIIDNIEVYFSGNRGFHIYLNWKNEMNVKAMHRSIKEELEDFIIQKQDPKIKLELPSKSDEIRLDITIYHPGGSIRVPYSLHKKTGLASIPVSNIMEFDPELATIIKPIRSYLNLFLFNSPLLR